MKELEAERAASLHQTVEQWNARQRAKPPVGRWPWEREMNARHAVTPHGGRTMVHEVVYDYALGYSRHQWSTFEDISKRYRGQIEKVPDAKGQVRAINRGDAWLESPERRQYEAEVFAPGRDLPANILNLYGGLAVAPRRGRWDRLRAHLRDTICSGDEAAFDYLLKWTARMFQQPGEAGQVAIVLKGDEGVGKGFFGRALGKAWGQHGIHLSNSRHLVGNFNSHLDCKVYCFADEALFAGNPEMRGTLYALITEDMLQIESKGVELPSLADAIDIARARAGLPGRLSGALPPPVIDTTATEVPAVPADPFTA